MYHKFNLNVKVFSTISQETEKEGCIFTVYARRRKDQKKNKNRNFVFRLI